MKTQFSASFVPFRITIKKAIIYRVGIALVICLLPTVAAAANLAPKVGTITPSAGTSYLNQRVNFTTTFSDPDGWQNIQFVHLLINTAISGANCFYGYYSQNTNLLYLRNNANSAWLGGYAPGSNNVIGNSYAKLDCAKTTVSGSGTTLTVNWSITFKPTFFGGKKTYLYVKDDLGVYNSWTQKGTWTISLDSLPSAGSIFPSSGTSYPNQTLTFTTNFSDPDGYKNISYGCFLINTAVNGSNCFYGLYRETINRLYLRDSNNTVWLGNFTPGSNNIIENNQAKLDCANSTVFGSGTNLTVRWKVTFKPGFDGTKNTYLYVKDDVGAFYNWTQKGTWNISAQPDTTAPTGNISINNNDATTDSSSIVLTLSAQDTGIGMGEGAKMRFSNDNSTWSASEDYAATKYWELPFGFGKRTVYAKFCDAAGNWANPVSDSIEVINVAKERIYIQMNGQRIAMEENGKKYFFHTDHLGSTSVITDEAGWQVSFTDYYPFGETKLQEGPAVTRRKFTGKELDEETGLYDYGARMYDTKICRFISADTIDPDLIDPQTLNRYSYCVNNPLKYIDPTGHEQINNINKDLVPGDVLIQRTNDANWISKVPRLALQHGAHCGIVLDIGRNDQSEIEWIRIGDLRDKPENQRILTNERYTYFKGKRVKEDRVFGEKIQDFDYFRVTNDHQEAAKAIEKAEHPEKLSIRRETVPRIAVGLAFMLDTSKPFDKNYYCSEYVNLLYNYKFRDPRYGAVLPDHIYEYQKHIKIRR
jgi:RHS repeat-associated protein